MKIVIIGGKGFIGTILTNKLKKEHDVSVWDLSPVDIRDPKTFTCRLEALKPDVVINLAAVLGTMKSSPSIVDLFEINTFGNLKVLQATYNAGVKNYLFTSSMTVHGENKIGEHQTLSSLFNPKHGYSASKASAEYSMQQFIKSATDMKVVTVRPTMVLGKGTYLPHAPIEFIKTILLGDKIDIYGEGIHEREWIWIDDVVDGIDKAIQFGVSADPGYYPFFLSGNRISMRDLAHKVAKKLDGEVIFTSSTAQAFTLTADSTESQSTLDWYPKYNIDKMLDELIRIIKNGN